MKKKFQLKNCYGEICELTLEMNNVKYIFRQLISGDEVYIVVYKSGKVKRYDSDRYLRTMSFHEEFEMIYPEKINLYAFKIEPDEVKNFICINKHEREEWG